MKTIAVIIASDKGGGLKSKKPKALAQVLFKPMLDWVIGAAGKGGAEDICVIAPCGDEMIREYLPEEITVVSAGETGHSFADLLSAKFFIEARSDADVVVLYGDTPFIDGETVGNAVAVRRKNGNEVILVIDEEEVSGAFCFSGEALLKLMQTQEAEKKSIDDAADMLNSDVYYTDNENAFLSAFTKSQMNRLNETARNDMLENLMDGGVDIPCRDGIIVGPDAVVGADTVILPNTVIIGHSHVGENCVIGPNSYIENAAVGNGVKFNNGQIRNAKILNDANIGPFVQIRPDSVIGNGVHLGNFVEVKNSVIDESTSVSHLTYVGDSDVGKNVNFGCGVVTVNFNGKTKNRTVIKDRAFIGCNTNLVAPVTVGENSYTAAGSTVTEDVPDNTLAIARERQTNKEGWVKAKQPYRKKV